jgi:hypothetical protein
MAWQEKHPETAPKPFGAKGLNQMTWDEIAPLDDYSVRRDFERL